MHTGDMSYLNFAGSAPYRATCINHAMYLIQCSRQQQNPSSLFSAPGFVFEYFCVDSMHAGDLGPFGDAIGGLMWIEVSSKTLHATYDAGVLWLNEQLAMYYAANPAFSPVQITLLMLKPSDGSHPTLKCKAAQCRHLSGFGLFLAARHKRINLQLEDERLAPHSAEYHTLAGSMASFLVQYHASCSEEPFSVMHCTDAMVGFLGEYNQLRLLFRRGLPLELHAGSVFGPRPKMHMCEHLVRLKVPLYGSPRLFWCYGDEDFMGLVKKILLKSKHSRSMERVLIFKYRLFAYLHSVALAGLAAAVLQRLQCRRVCFSFVRKLSAQSARAMSSCVRRLAMRCAKNV